MVNLKYGYGGRMIEAIASPIIEPDTEPKTTFTGINHLQIQFELCYYSSIKKNISI
jgi:hypothetical protein